METETQPFNWNAAYRRWIYMVVAIAATLMLQYAPVFSFQEDTGQIFVRSFTMNQKTIQVYQTDKETHVKAVKETMSVKGLYYCYWAMLIGCIACLLCFFSWRGRVLISFVTALIAGSYYVLMAYYAVKISDQQFATLYPNWPAVLPAITCQMMLLVRRNVINDVDQG